MSNQIKNEGMFGKSCLVSIFKELLLLILWVMSIAVAVIIVGMIREKEFLKMLSYWDIQMFASSFWNCLALVVGGIANFVSSCAWPLLVVAFVVLLHKKGRLDDALDAILKFVRNSTYGKDIQVGRKEFELDPGAPEDKRDETGLKRDFYKKVSLFESTVLNRLQDEEKRVIWRDIRIFNSNITFDGAIEKGRNIIAVEVKYNPSIDTLQEFLSRTDRFYQSLSDKDRMRFSLLICLCDEKNLLRERLHLLKQKIVVPVTFRFFDMPT